MNVKEIVFIEDLAEGIDNLADVARIWFEQNQDSIHIESGEYGSIENTNGATKDLYPYIRALRILYTGDTTSPNPQECKHLYSNETITREPTCTDPGEKELFCSDCALPLGKKPVGLIPHNLTWVYNEDATCLKDGTETGTCSMCSHKEHRIKFDTALGHNHIWAFDDNATCLDDGTETGVCSRCGDTITRTKEGSALGHQWSDWEIVLEPSYEANGREERVCSRCGEVESRVIPMLSFDLNITTENIPGAVREVEYEAYQLETNAPGDVTWTIVSGSIPNGMRFIDGLISGTPNTIGVFTFTVEAAFYSFKDRKTYTINVAAGMCTVTFNANGGTCTEISRTIPEGSVIGTLPVPTNSGQVFGGWFTAEVDGLKVDQNYSVSSDVTLYARWGESSDIVFGDATTQFNIHVDGDRTNYQDKPYTLYHRVAGGAAGTSNLVIQTGISSQDGSNNMSSTNKTVKLYLKVTNNGAAGKFDIGFDCDSYVSGNDRVKLTITEGGVRLGSTHFDVTVPYEHSVWIGVYSERTQNRYVSHAVGSATGDIDTGYCLTMKNIFINSGSYTILEVTFKKP